MDNNQIEEKKVKNTNKSTIFLVISLIITLLVISGFAMYAWARYTSRGNGTPKAPVAAWRFELKDGIVATEDQIDFPVTRTDGKFDVVADGTIAPGTWGEIPITVITTGTEEHMKYNIDIIIENCPTNLKFYKDASHRKEFTTTRTVSQNGEGIKTATITIEKYVDKEAHENNGEHQHIIYWYWPFETGTGNQIDDNDLIDSADMKLSMATMAITATGMQVLELQDDPDYVPETIYGLFEKSTGTLKLSHNPFVDYAEGDVPYTEVEKTTSGNPKWYSQRSNILNVEIIDEIRPESTYRWFYGCSKLTSLDLSNLDTENVTNMLSMFNGCSRLTSLDVSGFNTGSVVSMESMFQGCSRLTSLDVSGFNTGSVTNMQSMFRGCRGLTSLDVSKFNTGSVTNMGSMFYNCSGLTTIYASESFTTNKCSSSTDMFASCSNLKGGNGTAFTSSKVDKEYARIDTAETPGYFTAKTN